jgi:hypothetical protein
MSPSSAGGRDILATLSGVALARVESAYGALD